MTRTKKEAPQAVAAARDAQNKDQDQYNTLRPILHVLKRNSSNLTYINKVFTYAICLERSMKGGD